MIIGKINIDRGVLLAPMEGVSDLAFRIMCKRMGADIVYTEFIASEALIRDSVKSFNKMKVWDEERPVGVQIFGGKMESMIESAKIVEAMGADFLDINFGCWVPKVVKNNAGAAMLKEPDKMAEMSAEIVKSVGIPVTAKTRLGWDKNSIVIQETAKKLGQTGISALTIHCRTREMGMTGSADWDWVRRVKESVSLPIILNGDVNSAFDAKRAFDATNCDAVMIGRAAIGNPFIFKQTKDYLEKGTEPSEPTFEERIDACLLHLKINIETKGIPRAINEFRKHYSGYLKGMYNSHPVRQALVLMDSFDEIEDALKSYADELVLYREKEVNISSEN